VIRLLLPALLLAGCVSGQYSRVIVNEPMDGEVITGLEPGTDLQVCLDRLGAPLRVWESEAGQFAMAYGWIRERGWGVRASYSFYPYAPGASINYSDDLKRMQGAVLWFDHEMSLIKARVGLLSDLIPPRRRPVDVDLFDDSPPSHEDHRDAQS
jgi:hypothetical protein